MLHRHLALVLGSLFIFTLGLLALPGCGSNPVDITPTPTPTPTPSSNKGNTLTIDSQGGTLKVETGELAGTIVHAPAGSLIEGTTLEVSPLTTEEKETLINGLPENSGTSIKEFKFTMATAVFEKPIFLKIKLESSVDPGTAIQLVSSYRDGTTYPVLARDGSPVWGLILDDNQTVLFAADQLSCEKADTSTITAKRHLKAIQKKGVFDILLGVVKTNPVDSGQGLPTFGEGYMKIYCPIKGWTQSNSLEPKFRVGKVYVPRWSGGNLNTIPTFYQKFMLMADPEEGGGNDLGGDTFPIISKALLKELILRVENGGEKSLIDGEEQVLSSVLEKEDQVVKLAETGKKITEIANAFVQSSSVNRAIKGLGASMNAANGFIVGSKAVIQSGVRCSLLQSITLDAVERRISALNRLFRPVSTGGTHSNMLFSQAVGWDGPDTFDDEGYIWPSAQVNAINELQTAQKKVNEYIFQQSFQDKDVKKFLLDMAKSLGTELLVKGVSSAAFGVTLTQPELLLIEFAADTTLDVIYFLHDTGDIESLMLLIVTMDHELGNMGIPFHPDPNSDEVSKASQDRLQDILLRVYLEVLYYQKQVDYWNICLETGDNDILKPCWEWLKENEINIWIMMEVATQHSIGDSIRIGYQQNKSAAELLRDEALNRYMKLAEKVKYITLLSVSDAKAEGVLVQNKAGTLKISCTASDTDVDGNISAVQNVIAFINTIEGSSVGKQVLTKNANSNTWAWTGTVTPVNVGNIPITIIASKEGGKFKLTNVYVNVTVPNNHAPVVANQSTNTIKGTARDITLSATDADNDPLTFMIVTGPTHGTLVKKSGTVWTYTPTGNYFGSDSFTYKANDGKADSNTATVAITVSNTTPTPTPTPTVTPTPTPSISPTPTPTVTPTPTPTITPTPTPTPTPTVTPSSNTAPVVSDQMTNTTKNIPKDITLNGTDTDGDSLTFSIVSNPSHGTVTKKSNGSTSAVFTYTPNSGYVGSDSFTFKANDGKADSNTAKVTIMVTADTVGWAKQAGGLGNDNGASISAFSDGSCVVTGEFSGTATFGEGETLKTVCQGCFFIAKYNADGTLAWVKQADGTSYSCQNFGNSVSSFSDGSCVVTGYFKGSTTFGKSETKETTLKSAGSVFFAKYETDGMLAWVKQADGTSRGDSVSSFSDGSSVIIGSFNGTTTFGKGETKETTLKAPGDIDYSDIFIAKYNADGTLAWVKQAGGTGDDDGESVSSFSNGSCVVTGSFNGSATFGKDETNKTMLKSMGGNDIFIAKYNADGTLAWAKSSGGPAGGLDSYGEGGFGVSSCTDGSCVVVGEFRSTAMFGKDETNQTSLTSVGESDAFIAKYNADGTLAWVKQAGGTSYDSGYSNFTFSDGSCMVTGYFRYTATFGKGETNQTTLKSAGGDDIFIAKYNIDGTLAWVKQAGGTSYDYGRSVSPSSDGSFMVIGGFENTATFGKGETNETTLKGTSGGWGSDVFIAKYNADGTLAPCP